MPAIAPGMVLPAYARLDGVKRVCCWESRRWAEICRFGGGVKAVNQVIYSSDLARAFQCLDVVGVPKLW